MNVPPPPPEVLPGQSPDDYHRSMIDYINKLHGFHQQRVDRVEEDMRLLVQEVNNLKQERIQRGAASTNPDAPLPPGSRMEHGHDHESHVAVDKGGKIGNQRCTLTAVRADADVPIGVVDFADEVMLLDDSMEAVENGAKVEDVDVSDCVNVAVELENRSKLLRSYLLRRGCLEKKNAYGLRDWYLKGKNAKAVDVGLSQKAGCMFFQVLLQKQAWLEEIHISAAIKLIARRRLLHPNAYRHGVMLVPCFFISTLLWTWERYNKDPSVDLEWSTDVIDALTGHPPRIPGIPEEYTPFKVVCTRESLLCTVWNIGDHWVAVCVNMAKWSISVYDSMLRRRLDNETKENFRMVGMLLPRLLGTLSAFEGDTRIGTDMTFARVASKYVPQSKDSGDCGIYALEHMEHEAAGATLDAITQTHMPYLRLRLALDLFYQSTDMPPADGTLHKRIETKRQLTSITDNDKADIKKMRESRN